VLKLGCLGIDDAAFRSLVRNLPAEINFDIDDLPVVNRSAPTFPTSRIPRGAQSSHGTCKNSGKPVVNEGAR
jgi:hypothetical protein